MAALPPAQCLLPDLWAVRGWPGNTTCFGQARWCLRRRLPLTPIWTPLWRAVLPSLLNLLPMYLMHRGHLLTLPCRDARSQVLRRAFFGMDFLGSALPDEHADSCYACWCFFTLSLIRALSHEVQNSEINWTAEGKVP